jgi:hypothetical protein
VNPTEMLHQMCHEVLSEADVMAICKHRGLPKQAASSRQLFENLFLSDAGVAAALRGLDRTEIALLHLLAGQDQPVDVSFFSQLDPPRNKTWSHNTFTQRFLGVFAKVKERLVRRGILLLALGVESLPAKAKMERWEFALPVHFARHLPPLVESAKRLNSVGDWRSDVARGKLKTVFRQEAGSATKNERVEIVNGELHWGGKPFRADRALAWQKLHWQAETGPAKRQQQTNPFTLPPAEAVFHILAGLDAGLWSDADALAVPLEIYCGSRVDAGSVCESGWRWGLLARQKSDDRDCYRLAPPSADAEVPPNRYLAVAGDQGLNVDLDTVPFDALETLVQISDQRPVAGGQPLLRVTPNLLKLGRTADTVAPLPITDWLQKNAPAFRQAFETVQQRRGKTLIHENLLVARIADLSLKVALEKALGRRAVPLGEEFVAFPTAALAEVKRLVTQMGHVIKEVAHRKP